MQTTMVVVQIVLSALYFLALSLWGGGLVVLAIATALIDKAMQKKRTEGRQVVRRLRGVFQRMELIAITALWAASLAHLGLEHFFLDDYPGVWGAGDSIGMGVLVVPSIAALYSALYLTRAIRTKEAGLGSYADKDQQTRVRKAIAALHAQARVLTWLKAGMVAVLIIASVAATAAA